MILYFVHFARPDLRPLDSTPNRSFLVVAHRHEIHPQVKQQADMVVVLRNETPPRFFGLDYKPVVKCRDNGHTNDNQLIREQDLVDWIDAGYPPNPEFNYTPIANY